MRERAIAPVRLVGRLWRENRGALQGLIILVALVVTALFAPWLSPHPFDEQDLTARFAEPIGFGGDWNHPLGTDHLGRDVLSRVMYGARNSLLIGTLTVVLAGVFGTALGLIAGFRGGWADRLIYWWVEIQLAFPGLVLALVLLAFIGGGITAVIIVLAANGWMVFAQVIRGEVITMSASPYIEASRVIGCRPTRIMLRHLLPNLAAVLSVLVVLEFARILLAEATLSFLGYGLTPPDTSWGYDISLGREYMFRAWWLVTMPGIALALSVLGANLFGGWLRTIANPEAAERDFARSMRARRRRSSRGAFDGGR